MSLIRDAVDKILPQNCVICGKYPDADGRIPYPVPDNFHICFKCLSGLVPQPPDRRFFLCLSEPYEGDPYPSLGLYMPFPYKGFFETAVPRMKFRSCPQIAQFAGMLLGAYMYKDGVNASLIVPVPLSDKRLRERGYNQAELIAYEASKICNIPFAQDVLVRMRDTRRQTELGTGMVRSANVEGAFKVSSGYDVTGLKVIVVDDVATTGFTLHEAALELYKAGASEVFCCAVCGNRAVLNAESF